MANVKTVSKLLLYFVLLLGLGGMSQKAKLNQHMLR